MLENILQATHTSDVRLKSFEYHLKHSAILYFLPQLSTVLTQPPSHSVNVTVGREIDGFMFIIERHKSESSVAPFL
jgi:hypothetical protein